MMNEKENSIYRHFHDNESALAPCAMDNTRTDF
jgi:hypothetical protein